MESRLLLSGNQASGDLDYAIWNLDSIQHNYAIISQGNSLPTVTSTTPSATDSDGAQLDVSWVTVPGMTLSAGEAQELSYRHLRDAMSQGVINLQQVSSLYLPLRDGFSTDPNSLTAPVYAIGVRDHNIAPAVGGKLDSLGGSGPIASDSIVYVAPPISNSLGSLGSSLGLNSTAIQSGDTSAGLFDDVRSSGDFNRDGIVNAGDYFVWRNNVGSSIDLSDRLAYDNWKEHFGQSYIVGSVAIISLGDNLAVDQDGVPNLQHTLLSDSNPTSETSAHVGSLTAGIDAQPWNQVDSFVNATTPILKLDLSESSVGASPLTGEAFTDQRLVIAIGPITIATADGANIAASRSTLTFDADSGTHQLVLPPVPVGVEAPVTPSRQSKAEVDLAEAIDELLSEDAIIVYQNGETNVEKVADAKPTQIDSTPDAAAGNVAAAATVEQLAEGGMISVDKIVDAAAGGSAEISPSDTRIASGAASTELVGELARVTVMELIEGETEPAAPNATADHVSLQAADNAANADPSASVAGKQFVVGSIVRVIAEHSGTATSIIAPVNPAYLATIANAASHAFAAVIGTELNGTMREATGESTPGAGNARSEAFSQWGSDESDNSEAVDNASNSWLGAAPLLMALACERVIAVKKKRQQNEREAAHSAQKS